MIKVRNISNRTLTINKEKVLSGNSILLDDYTNLNSIKNLEQMNLVSIFYNVKPVEIIEEPVKEQLKSKNKKK